MLPNSIIVLTNSIIVLINSIIVLTYIMIVLTSCKPVVKLLGRHVVPLLDRVHVFEC